MKQPDATENVIRTLTQTPQPVDASRTVQSCTSFSSMTKIRFVSANVLPVSTLMIQHENANVSALSKACTPTNWHENAWENAQFHTEPTTWITPAYRHAQNFISTTSPETSAPNAQLSVSYAPTPPAAWNALQDTICSTEFAIFPANPTTVSSRILILKAFV